MTKYEELQEYLKKNQKPVYRDFRAGDNRHSQADITKAKTLLNYQPTHKAEQVLDEIIDWYTD